MKVSVVAAMSSARVATKYHPTAGHINSYVSDTRIGVDSLSYIIASTPNDLSGPTALGSVAVVRPFVVADAQKALKPSFELMQTGEVALVPQREAAAGVSESDALTEGFRAVVSGGRLDLSFPETSSAEFWSMQKGGACRAERFDA